jgi:dienelactone hydrolase
MQDYQELSERQNTLYNQLLEWLGDLPPRPAPDPQTVDCREYAFHTEMKLHYQGEGGDIIPAYLLLPREPIRRPVPAILAAHQCGHLCDIGKEQVVGHCADLPDQAYGLDMARRGFAVLAPDAKNVGERYNPELREPWQRVQDLGGQEACCRGPGGCWADPHWKRVSDVMTAMDVLSSWPGIDEARLGMMGFSMGSDLVLWSMPFETRIRCATVCPGGIVKPPGIGGWDPYGLPYREILELICPRPLFVAYGSEDPINFLEKGNLEDKSLDELLKEKREAHKSVRECYELREAGDKLRVEEFPGGHEFPDIHREQSYDWFEKWLAEH